MISKDEIERKAQEFGINATDVEKDYIHSWILNGVQTQSQLGQQLILKGGNGLRKAYLPNTRYSKDLDFSCRTQLDPTVLKSELKRVCEFVEHQSRVQFATDRTLVKNKDVPGIDALEARLYFKGFCGEENIVLKAQLDISQFDKIYLPVQSRSLLHPYSDASECAVTLRCQKIEEILASKLTTLLHRRKAVDLFDLLYSVLFSKECSVNRLEVITTFLKKSIFEPQPILARDQLLALPLQEFEPLWSTIVAPLRSMFDFAYVLANFRSLIESLFSYVSQAATRLPSFVPVGRGSGPRVSQRSPGSQSIPTYFSWDARNAIVAAARSRTLIELTYDGFRRLVEPYRIEYYVRKSDGVGSEYFWGYDNSGGKSGRIGIKQFFCSKIQNVRQTDIAFAPRYVIEF